MMPKMPFYATLVYRLLGQMLRVAQLGLSVKVRALWEVATGWHLRDCEENLQRSQATFMRLE